MSKRHRLTRRASPPPAIPTAPEHPAMQPDPGKDDYKSGDTSAWAEDPHPGPYAQPAHPATPTELPAHPASKAAADVRIAAEQKAAKCIRIAQALLGPNAPTEEVEDQAFPFMHLADAHIDATLARMGQFAGGQKSASASTTDPTLRRLARIEKSLRDIKAMMDQGVMSMGEEMPMDEEAMLAQMLEEEAMASDCGPMAMDEDAEAEAMLRAMLAQEEGEEDEDESEGTEVEVEVEVGGDDDDDEEEDEDEMEDEMEKEAGDMDIQLIASDIDAPEIAENDSLLKSIFASEDEEMEEEEMEMEEEMEAKAASKTASQQPRPRRRKASKGAKAIGSVAAGKSAAEMGDLANLWESAPDVSDYFTGR